MLIILFSVNQGNAQLLTENQKRTVDSLTAHWNSDKHPGGAIAILQKDKIVAQYTLGLANITTKKKITAQTAFPLAQLSDGFIAFAILQLHHQKKLSLEDKVNQYLPQLQQQFDALNIKHLLQQSSGIHDFEVLKNIAGWKDTDAFSIADALLMISNQRSLNFHPGTSFTYSRSNMLLASQIIAKASKISFSDYMLQHVFEPLGMTNTFVLLEENQTSENLANSYRENEDGNFNLIPSKKENYASISIATSIEDLVKWEKNLFKPSKATAEIVAHFNRFVVLQDGSYFNVPRGKLTYGQRYIHKERGIDTAMVTGGIDGFASAIFNFPTEDFTFITLSNNGEAYNGYIGMLSAHAILGDTFTEPPTIDFDALETIPLDKNYHSTLEGHYWDAVGEISREIRIENDTLRYIRSNNRIDVLLPISKNRFQMKTQYDDKIFIQFSKKGDKTIMEFEYGEATPFLFTKYQKISLNETALQSAYTGTYFCEALQSTYVFTVKEGKLQASTKELNMEFTPIIKNLFSGNQWFMASIVFAEDEKGKTKGFFVKNDAIRNLWFEKID